MMVPGISFRARQLSQVPVLYRTSARVMRTTESRIRLDMAALAGKSGLLVHLPGRWPLQAIGVLRRAWTLSR
ncbi:MAG: hypothetical protein AMXMBFR45_04930 [Gammaproteobacteria bacterium]